MKLHRIIMRISIVLLLPVISCEKDGTDDEISHGSLQLFSVKIGTQYLTVQGSNNDIAVDKSIVVSFSNPLDTNTVRDNIQLKAGDDNDAINFDVTYMDDFRTIVLQPYQNLSFFTGYTLQITERIKGAKKEAFAGVEYSFITVNGTMKVTDITINGMDFYTEDRIYDIERKKITISISFSEELDASTYNSFIRLSGNQLLSYSLLSDNKSVVVTNNDELAGFTRYFLTISPNLTSKTGFSFEGFFNSFYTGIDSTYKFPAITDEQLLDLIQEHTFRYFYDFAHPACGMALERNTSGDIVTTGGSGFGIMALIVGMERNYISRSQGIARLNKILNFLETCDRFHGAWPHWLDGNTGNTIPFGLKDDGGDLVETAFMLEGLLTIRQTLDSATSAEKDLINRINTLFNAVEFDWYTRGQDVLYWHWSPVYNWDMNMQIQGYNETLITYILAASSTSHGIAQSVYHKGYARSGGIVNGQSYYGYKLPLGWDYGGPLFFTHYSFLGLDPRNLSDIYASYWEQNVNHTLINWAYCVDNPKHFVGYGTSSWGLTASDNHEGYSAHSPTNDLGVISPTAAVSSIPYTPDQSMKAIRHFYYFLGDKLWGEYGFYDAFNITEQWWADSYLAIDQGPIICMIENYRTALLWNLFMSCPEIRQGLDKLGFSY